MNHRWNIFSPEITFSAYSFKPKKLKVCEGIYQKVHIKHTTVSTTKTTATTTTTIILFKLAEPGDHHLGLDLLLTDEQDTVILFSHISTTSSVTHKVS